MIKAAIIAGQHAAIPRLVHLLHTHPDVELVAFCNPQDAGRPLSEIFPSMTGETDLFVTSAADWNNVDVVFIASAPGEARKFLKTANLPADIRIIDMSGDYRRSDDTHDFVSGICELNRKAIVRGARHVALPDARTLAVALGLLPLAKNLMLNSPIRADIVANDTEAHIGSMKSETLTADIIDELTAALSSLQSSFAAPINGVIFRGDIPSGTMAVISLDSKTDLSEIKRLYDEYYDDHNFTFTVNRQPDTADVRDTNKCFIHLSQTDGRLTITTVLDTAFKGNAGNAVHAMNLLFGLTERVGL